MDTITGKDFQLLSCQATLFTPEEEVSTAKILRDLLSQAHWTERFNDEPVILPAPIISFSIGAISQREVPRIILKSKDPGTWRCEISSGRMSLFWQQVISHVPEPTLKDFFATDAMTFLVDYQEVVKARVGRLAAVLTRYVQCSSPGEFLVHHFCKDRWLEKPFNDPRGFELHTHKRYMLAQKFSVNSWVRSKTGQIPSEEGNQPILVVEQDLNTLVEKIEEENFSKEDFKEFFVQVATEFDKILRLYYPEEG